MAGRSEGVPGEVQPGGTGEKLVGEGVGLEEVDEAMELGRILRRNEVNPESWTQLKGSNET